MNRAEKIKALYQQRVKEHEEKERLESEKRAAEAKEKSRLLRLEHSDKPHVLANFILDDLERMADLKIQGDAVYFGKETLEKLGIHEELFRQQWFYNAVRDELKENGVPEADIGESFIASWTDWTPYLYIRLLK